MKTKNSPYFSTSQSLFLYSLLLLLGVSCKKETPQKEAKEPEIIEKKVNPAKASLKNALTIYASFDKGPNADFALGDNQLYSVPSRKARDSAQVGIHLSLIHI